MAKQKSRNRVRSEARPSPFREYNARILVVCEGRVTEPSYLLGYVREVGNPLVKFKACRTKVKLFAY